MSSTSAITGRFVKAMAHIIMNQKLANGKVTTVKAFAESIGHSGSNFSKFAGKSRRDVTVEMIEAVSRKYQVNPTWLILGTGSMFSGKPDPTESRLDRLEQELKKLSGGKKAR